MDEQHILERILALVEEEQTLREEAPSSAPDYVHSPENARLKRVEEDLLGDVMLVRLAGRCSRQIAERMQRLSRKLRTAGSRDADGA